MTTTGTATPTAAARPGIAADLARSARSELLRLRKWPAVWITLGSWLALGLMFGYLFNYLSYTTGDTSFSNEGTTSQGLLAEMMPAAVPDVYVQGMPMFGGALMMVLGAIAAGNGYGWGTWKTVFGLGARRTTTVVGALVALTAIVVVTLAAWLALCFGVSTLIAATEGQEIVMPGPASMGDALGAGFLVMEMWALAGYALGTLARGPALSVGLGLVWALVVENLLRGVGALLDWVETATTVLPGTAACSLIGSIVGVEPGADTTPGVLDTLSGTQAALTVAAYVVLLPLLTLWLVRRRDVA